MSSFLFLSLVSAASTGSYFQPAAPWGLARIAHRDWNLDRATSSPENSFINTYYYSYAQEQVTVYILDTGVDINHPEFAGRASWGPNFVTNTFEDDNGHGTHLAGIIAGGSVGVARQANIVAVKILDHNRTGSVEHFSQAVDWVINDTKSRQGKFVINYSAVGDVSDPRSNVVSKAIQNGILIVNAAGNNNNPACNYGPANMGLNTKGFLVVAALNFTNTPASFTNYGECVNVYAPGVSINSTLPNNGYGFMAGTSSAAAFVSGIAAYLWALNPGYSIYDIDNAIRSGNTNAVGNNLPDTANAIVYNYFF